MSLASDGFHADDLRGAKGANGFVPPRDDQTSPRHDPLSRIASEGAPRTAGNDPLARLSGPELPRSPANDPLARVASEGPPRTANDPLSRMPGTEPPPTRRESDQLGRMSSPEPPRGPANDPLQRGPESYGRAPEPPRPPMTSGSRRDDVGGGRAARGDYLDTSHLSPPEHPLIHGLLLELPPRGTPLQRAWMDRWMEAARATLELLYGRPTDPKAR